MLFNIFNGVGHQVLQEGHDIFLVSEGHFHVNGDGFVQVTQSVVFFRPEDRGNLVYFVQTGGHHHLLVKLGALAQESFSFKVGYGK